MANCEGGRGYLLRKAWLSVTEGVPNCGEGQTDIHINRQSPVMSEQNSRQD